MAGGTTVFHRTINSKASLGRHEQKQQQHQKQNPFEGKTLGLLLQKDSCFQNQLDTADFLIDGLTEETYALSRNDAGNIF